MDELYNCLCLDMRRRPEVNVVVDGKTMPIIITNMETDRFSYEQRIKIRLEGVVERCSSTGNETSNIPFHMMHEKIIFNKPATIVIWKDGTKTVVKCQKGDEYNPEKGLALCFMKKALGNKGNFNNVLKSVLLSN
ncbi:MAG: hypothetical protein NC413_04430 [Muribaculum sp.]|nr:hypothetical protein [Muribaculum sp.]